MYVCQMEKHMYLVIVYMFLVLVTNEGGIISLINTDFEIG